MKTMENPGVSPAQFAFAAVEPAARGSVWIKLP